MDINLNMHLAANPEIFRRANMLRKNMTKMERLLWTELRNKKLEGYKFRCQHPILTYILDFYCHEMKLGVELDGRSHDDIDQRQYDENRTQSLEEFGFKIIRFTNNDVVNNIEKVKSKILTALRYRSLKK